MDTEAKSRLILELLKDAVESNSEYDGLLIKILEQDIADGGLRFEQLYYASNSFYGL